MVVSAVTARRSPLKITKNLIFAGRPEVQCCALDTLSHLAQCSAKPGEFTKYSRQG